MLRVLSGTGWQCTQRFDGPVVSVRIDLESTKDDSPMADCPSRRHEMICQMPSLTRGL